MSRVISTTITVECKPSAEDLAKVFWEMDNDEQAVFWNTLGSVSAGSLSTQLQYVVDSDHLNKDGIWAMSKIGEYSAEVRSERIT